MNIDAAGGAAVPWRNYQHSREDVLSVSNQSLTLFTAAVMAAIRQLKATHTDSVSNGQ